GAPRVSRITPKDGSAGIAANTPIQVVFDQEVDHAAAEAAFSLEPTIDGSFSWSGSTLTYRANFAKDTRYSARIAAGIPGPYGLKSTGGAAISFNTEESSHILAIALDYQDKALSC